MPNLDEEICSASDCNFAISFQHGCVDYLGRKYCRAECAYVTLEREGIFDPIEKVDSLKNLEKKASDPVDYLNLG